VAEEGCHLQKTVGSHLQMRMTMVITHPHQRAVKKMKSPVKKMMSLMKKGSKEARGLELAKVVDLTRVRDLEPAKVVDLTRVRDLGLARVVDQTKERDLERDLERVVVPH